MEPPVEELILVTEEPAAAVSHPAEPASKDVEHVERSVRPRPRASRTPSENGEGTPSTAPEGADEPSPVPAPVSTSESRGPPSSARAPIDLGIGGYWKSIAMTAPSASAVAAETSAAAVPSTAPSSPNRILRDVLDARDHAMGLGPSGPIVAAAHEAASLPDAPEVGSATIEVIADATGLVTAANVLSSSGGADPAGWNKVAGELVRLLASKRLHLPRGARGHRAQLRIVAERVLPSGSQKEQHAGAVPDDVPGADPVCEGEGTQRKCTAGMPIGFTGTLGDVANIGAKMVRVVRARILGEATL